MLNENQSATGKLTKPTYTSSATGSLTQPTYTSSSTGNLTQPTYTSSSTLSNCVYETDEDELMTVRTANNWLQRANKRAIPQMLFGKFWFQGELCILFADSNLGKSILAVQIANSISTGISAEPFSCEAEIQPVLYCDFELTEKQFEARYSIDYQNHYSFNDNFYRAELNPDSDLPQGFRDFDEYLSACLERSIVQTDTKVVIIDNITYLGNENEKAKNALPLMKQLKALKNRYGLSILALAHTPKRDMSLALTRNDLQGSKMLMNFCDSAFAIGESTVGKNLRYLKQIKQRNTGQEYDANNVCICEVAKPDNFLLYRFTGYGTEADHLRKPNAKTAIDPEEAQEALRLQETGLSLREIAAQIDKSYQQVYRMIKSVS